MLGMTVDFTDEPMPVPAKAMTMHQKFRPISVIDPGMDFGAQLPVTSALINQRKHNNTTLGGSRRRNIETPLHQAEHHLNFTNTSTLPH